MTKRDFQQQEYEQEAAQKQTILLGRTETDSRIRQSVIDLADDGPVELEVWKGLYLNSYEREYLYEFLTDEALLSVCNDCIKNTTKVKFISTYEEAIVHKLFPEVCTRLAERNGAH